jgi:tRNA pseudouridine38-40 synthase
VTARMLIEYDGTRFAGWARQPGRRTLQGELEAALAAAGVESPGLTVAGRTDAGVHARGQVASHHGAAVPAARLNALLAADMAVVESGPAAEDFDARRDARSRTYRYRVLARAQASPFEHGRALHWRHELERGALQACAAALRGTHDFTAFTPSRSEHVRFEREVLVAEWRQPGQDVLELWVEADSFMRHMVRTLVGTMLGVASGRSTPASFERLLEGRPRAEAGDTAPAHGLCLESVRY